MIIIKQYSEYLKHTWDEFVKSSKNGTFMLERDYMDYHADRFIDNSLMFYKDDKLFALLPASLNGEVIISHSGLTYGGFVVDDNMKASYMLECFDTLKRYMLDNKFERLIYKCIPYIYHKKPCEEDLYALFYNNANLIRRDIASVVMYENIIKIDSRKRNKINKSKKANIQIVYGKFFDDFINLENEILWKYHQTKAVHTADELLYLKSKFPDNIHLYEARQEEKLLAGVVIYEYENLVHTQYMANSDEGRKLGALDLIIDFLITEKYNNKKYFDFGISTENSGKYLNNGLISQKEEFGGRAVVYDFYELLV